jgi:hypothetical protein
MMLVTVVWDWFLHNEYTSKQRHQGRCNDASPELGRRRTLGREGGGAGGDERAVSDRVLRS